MHLTIMTLDRRTVTVDIADWKTVWDLKVQLCRMRGIWVRPEMQQLLYSGQVLKDRNRLRHYCIDERRFLLMLTKKPLAYTVKNCNSMKGLNQVVRVNKSNKTDLKQEKRIVESKTELTLSAKELIMRLGPWTESDVRRALLISMNNTRRAVEFLIKGTDLFPNMVTPPPSVLLLAAPAAAKKIDSLVRVTNDKPLPRENVATIKLEKLSKWEIPHCTSSKVKNRETIAVRDVDHLIEIGFPRDIVLETYGMCDGNAEQTAELLFQQYRDLHIYNH